jgi:hypothetical protein
MASASKAIAVLVYLAAGRFAFAITGAVIAIGAGRRVTGSASASAWLARQSAPSSFGGSCFAFALARDVAAIEAGLRTAGSFTGWRARQLAGS